MKNSNEKIKVNLIVSHKSDIYMEGKTPCGERRLDDNDFTNALKEKVEIHQINLGRPFKKRLPFTQNLETLMYHLKNISRVKKSADKEAVSHIFFGEESSILNFIRLKKSVVTCLDIIPLAFPVGIPWYNRILYKWLISGMKKADRIIAISEYTKQDLIKYLHLKAEKIKVAYWGINKIFKQTDAPESFYKKYGLDPQKKFIVSVGALDFARKNIAMLIKIFPALQEKFPELELIIAGYINDQGKDPYKDLGSSAAYHNKMHFLEKIPDEDLCYLYNAAHVFVFPSLYEGFGLPPVEAMACGTPVVCSNRASLPEAVGDAALLVDPTKEAELIDAISKLMSNNSLRDTMIQKGLTHVKKFSWEKYAEDLYQTYREL